MTEVEVFQLHGADVIGVRHLHIVFVFLRDPIFQLIVVVGVAAGYGLRAVSGFRLHGLRKDILLFKQHIEDTANLRDRPFSAHQRGDRGNQDIWIVFDVVQLIMVFVVIVLGFVVVQPCLQFCLHRAILCLCRQHIFVLRRIGGSGNRRACALEHQGTGGKQVSEQQENRRDQADNEKAFFVLGNKLSGFLSGLCTFFCRLFCDLRCLDRIRCAASGFCGSVLPLDCAFLLPAGIRIGGKAVVLLCKLLIQRLYICLIRLFLRPVRLAVWLKRMGMVDFSPHLIGALGIFRQRIGGVHTGIVAVIALPHFPVNAVQHGVAGNLRGVTELGRRLLFLKRKACRDLPIGIHNTLLYLFLWDLRLGLFQLFDPLVCFLDGRRKLRRSTLFLGKLQPGCAFCHRTSPHSHKNGLIYAISPSMERNSALPFGVTSVYTP